VSDLSALTTDGVDLLVSALGEVTGTLYDGSESHAFESAAVVDEGREAQPGKTDVRSRTLLVAAAGVDAAPRARWRLTFTGDAATWAVLEAEPVAPGGTVVAWRLSIVDRVDR
jgi:hypothetical protein